MFNSRFKSLKDLQDAFPTEQRCIDYLEERRWGVKVVSPFDPTSKVYKCKYIKYFILYNYMNQLFFYSNINKV